mmetsp:Transcript_7558/g.13448  ORF Transcript_7558/g.13448 Transcript_7558/m.13448 type:complete len:92 (-) Transcript_7558:1121-1396(-)
MSQKNMQLAWVSQKYLCSFNTTIAVQPPFRHCLCADLILFLSMSSLSPNNSYSIESLFLFTLNLSNSIVSMVPSAHTLQNCGPLFAVEQWM